MDILIPFKNIESIIEDENFKNSKDLQTWNDVGTENLLGRHLNLNELK